jgi:hypothetical protein
MCARRVRRSHERGISSTRPNTDATGPRVASGFIAIHTRTFYAKLHFGPTVLSAVGTGHSGCPGSSEERPETTDGRNGIRVALEL